MMTDPIADMLTRIRNGQHAKHHQVAMRHSRIKEDIARVLKDEGYIADYRLNDNDGKKELQIDLKSAAIKRISRVSVPGHRRYCGVDEIPTVLNGMGIVVLSTNKGVITGRNARKEHVGGEILCEVE